MIEVLCLLSGLICAAVAIKLRPTKVVAFVAISLGGLLSGYIYTARTIRIHAHLKLTRGITDSMVEDE